MPQKVVCNDCKTILYQGHDLKGSGEIASMYGGKCPTCGKKLATYPINVEIGIASGEELKIILPSQVIKRRVEEKKYKLPPTIESTEEKLIELIEADFLNTFRNGINTLITKFGHYRVSGEIKNVCGHNRIHNGVLLSIRLSLDKGPGEIYRQVTRIVEFNLERNKCIYYEREDPFLTPWRQVDPEDVPLELRRKYQEKLMKRFEILSERLSSESKP